MPLKIIETLKTNILRQRIISASARENCTSCAGSFSPIPLAILFFPVPNFPNLFLSVIFFFFLVSHFLGGEKGRDYS